MSPEEEEKEFFECLDFLGSKNQADRTCDSASFPAPPPLDLASFYSTEPPAFDFVLPGFLAGTVGVMASPGGAGKSILALQTAHSIAAGRPTLLNPTEHTDPAKVVIFNGEDPTVVMHHRVRAIGKTLSDEEQKLAATNLQILPFLGLEKNVFDLGFLSSVIKPAEGARLVIFDTLRRFHTGEENDNGEMSALIGQFERLVKETGAAVLLLHHAGKNTTDLKGNSLPNSRGASAITDNSRYASSLQKMTDLEAQRHGVSDAARHEYVQFSVTKQNYSAQPQPVWLRRGLGGLLIHTEFLGNGGGTAHASQASRERPSRRANQKVQVNARPISPSF